MYKLLDVIAKCLLAVSCLSASSMSWFLSYEPEMPECLRNE